MALEHVEQTCRAQKRGRMKVEVGKRYTFQITAGLAVKSLTRHQVVRINVPIIWVQEDDAGPLIPLDTPIAAKADIDD